MKKYLTKMPPYLPSVIITLLLFYLTLAPNPLPRIEPPFSHVDKLVHVAMMLVVSLIYTFDYTRQERQHMLSLPVSLWVLFSELF